MQRFLFARRGSRRSLDSFVYNQEKLTLNAVHQLFYNAWCSKLDVDSPDSFRSALHEALVSHHRPHLAKSLFTHFSGVLMPSLHPLNKFYEMMMIQEGVGMTWMGVFEISC